MVKRLLPILVLALLAGLAWRHFFPNEEKRLRRLLTELAQDASVPESSKPLGHLALAGRLSEKLTHDVEIQVTVLGQGPVELTGREEILQAALAARSHYRGLRVEFLDVSLQVEPDGLAASAELTGRARQRGSRDIFVQELKFSFRKEDGRWRVSRVETIQTLRL